MVKIQVWALYSSRPLNSSVTRDESPNLCEPDSPLCKTLQRLMQRASQTRPVDVSEGPSTVPGPPGLLPYETLDLG